MVFACLASVRAATPNTASASASGPTRALPWPILACRFWSSSPTFAVTTDRSALRSRWPCAPALRGKAYRHRLCHVRHSATLRLLQGRCRREG